MLGSRLIMTFFGLENLWSYFIEKPDHKILDPNTDLLKKSALYEKVFESLPSAYLQIYAGIYNVQNNDIRNPIIQRISLYLSLYGVMMLVNYSW